MAQRERRLISEYLAFAYSKYRTITQVYLGEIKPNANIADLTQGELRYLGRWRRFADALVIRETDLVLIEGSLISQPGRISQLKLYAKLLPNTPELQKYLPRPIALEYVVAIEDVTVSNFAREEGVTPSVFYRDWMKQYLSSLPGLDPRRKLLGKISS